MTKIPVRGELEVGVRPMLNIPTPRWILEWIAHHDGGWFFPIPLTANHPLLEPEWECEYCHTPFESGHAFVTPLSDRDNPRWLAYHHGCMARMLGFERRAGVQAVPEDQE